MGEPAEVGLVDRVADRFDASVAEDELRHAGVPTAEFLGPNGVGARSKCAGSALGRRGPSGRSHVAGALSERTTDAGAAADEGAPDAGVDRAVADLHATEHPGGNVLLPGEERVTGAVLDRVDGRPALP